MGRNPLPTRAWRRAIRRYTGTMKTLYALIESPFHPDLAAIYTRLGYATTRFTRARDLHRAVQTQPPDAFVGEFIYGWGNNYAGANISNLDVTLRTLQCRAPQAKLIVLYHPREAEHIDKLTALFPACRTLPLPIDEARLAEALA